MPQWGYSDKEHSSVEGKEVTVSVYPVHTVH